MSGYSQAWNEYGEGKTSWWTMDEMGILADPIIGMGGSFKAEMVTTMSWTLVLRTYEYRL